MPRKSLMHALRVSHDDSEIGLNTSTCTLSSSSVIEDIDETDAERRECIVEYATDVMDDLTLKEEQQHTELRSLPKSTIAERSVLVAWMELVRKRFALLLDTMLLAVSILDRYASLHVPTVSIENEEKASLTVLNAGAALLLAAALEETFAPTAEDMLRACTESSFRPPGLADKNVFQNCGTLTRMQVCSATSDMAHMLGYNLWSVTFLHFLRRFSRASQHSVSEHNFAKDFCIAALNNYNDVVLQLRPSAIAAAGIYRTRLQFPERFRKPWSKTLKHFTGYDQTQAEQFFLAIERAQTDR